MEFCKGNKEFCRGNKFFCKRIRNFAMEKGILWREKRINWDGGVGPKGSPSMWMEKLGSGALGVGFDPME